MKRALLVMCATIMMSGFAITTSFEFRVEAAEQGDVVTAVDLFQQKADQGYAYAQHILGWAYYMGKGAPQDYVISYMWFSLAIEGGNTSAKKIRGHAEKRMTAEQIAEAKLLAREWKPIDQR